MDFRVSVSLILILSSAFADAQPVITSASMPNAGDLLAQETAVFSGNVDFETTGANHVWNFTSAQLVPTGVINQSQCTPIGQIPFTYQVFFNNPFLQEHYSTHFISPGSVDAGEFQLENVNVYYQNRTNRFAITGASASIFGIPSGAQNNPVDVVYQLPLEFGNTSQSNSILIYNVPTLGSYRTNQVRQNNVDGWGTLNLLGSSYEVLRVRTVINAIDSIYIDFLETGQEFERPETIEYKWLSPGIKVPVLQVTTVSGAVSSVQIVGTPVNVVESNSGETFSWNYLRDAETIIVRGEFARESRYMIHDITGRLIRSGEVGEGIIQTGALSAGVHLFTVIGENRIFSGRFVR